MTNIKWSAVRTLSVDARNFQKSGGEFWKRFIHLYIYWKKTRNVFDLESSEVLTLSAELQISKSFMDLKIKLHLFHIKDQSSDIAIQRDKVSSIFFWDHVSDIFSSFHRNLNIFNMCLILNTTWHILTKLFLRVSCGRVMVNFLVKHIHSSWNLRSKLLFFLRFCTKKGEHLITLHKETEIRILDSARYP